MRLRDLAAVAIIFVIAGITLGIGAEILDEVHSDVSSTYAKQALKNTTEGQEELGGWMPTIALVIAAGLVITIIFASFAAGRV